MVFRFDLATGFRKPRKTPEGFLVADALPTRTGIFTYLRADGTQVNELRPPEEVFAPASLASLAAATLTSGHPDAFVSAENASGVSVGHVGETPERHQDHVKISIYVKDAKAVADVENRHRDQLSCGYTCDMDATPGVYKGQRYDQVQRNIRYNHVALVTEGRAGPENRIRLDAQDAVEIEKPQTGAPKVQKIRIDGVEYEVSEQAAQAFAKFEENAKKDKADLATQSARADSAEGKVKEKEAELKTANDPKRVDEAVNAKLALVKVADKAEVKHDGKSDDEIRRAVIAKVKPSIKLDGKDAAYVGAMFDICADEVKTARSDDSETELVTERSDASDVLTQKRAAAEKARQDQANAWKQPLTATKGAK